jgi:fatty acid desaturase
MSEITLSLDQRSKIRELGRIQSTAWPTVLLLLASYAIWFMALYFAAVGSLPIWALTLLATLTCITAFTPMHEAVHGAVSPSKPFNECIGRLASSALLSPFKGFRYIHLKHHRFTNKKVDPDLWSAASMLPLRWISQDLYYYFIYILDRRENSLAVRIEVVVQIMVLLAIAVFAVLHGYVWIVVFGWLVPARLATAWLAFAFNWLPHLPHDENVQDNAYKETCVRSSPFLDLPLYYQNYHLIHHLYPAAPFFHYAKIWAIGKAYYLSQGTREVKELWKL